MSVKGLLLLPFVALAMVASASSFAEEQPRSMLGSFDLKSAVLSPVPLGPPSQFVPPPAVAASNAVAPPIAAAPPRIVSSKPRQKTAVVARKPKSNPLDSYARDSRRQTWPCVGDGICAWTQQR